ncbi:DNA-directed RNA polymerase III subunit RPC2 [[Emmonsia] crescens]|uniref:DNA-directed RNA polymerase III subunit RPC2 n=1 Tax=[Emmonsia] crescens TaxID=73230 RepID=A0A2B7ZKJ2_9EURO|nr:DNA-directed RNA polymerase III subunit RPC2 [Emmonsia crescens]
MRTFRVPHINSPPRYVSAAVIASTGGILNGLDTGVIGPVTTMKSFTDEFGHPSPAIHGMIVSSILLSMAFASLFAGSLSDNLGRTRAIALGALLFAIGATVEAGASILGVFIFGRLIAGIGQGFFLSTLVVYICEISPAKHRGLLASLIQFFITSGLVVGYFACYGTVRVQSSFSWRFPIALQSGIALFLTALFLFYLPESPRWLHHHGHRVAAEAVCARLGISIIESDGETEGEGHPYERPNVEELSTFSARLRHHYERSVHNLRLILGPGARKQALLGVFLMSMQQLSGIDGVIYYAPLLFKQAGLSSSTASFLASGVSAILICLASIPAFLYADKIGRRASALYGGSVLAAIMALIGSLYASNSVHPVSGAGRWVVIVSIYLFSITYSMTWALGLKIYSSEIQSVSIRATVTSIAQSANCMTNFFVAYITPTLLNASSFGMYFLFCGCVVITVVIGALFMPETRGQPLESIAEAFSHHSARSTTLMRLLLRFVAFIRGFSERHGYRHRATTTTTATVVRGPDTPEL